ncbi:MAG: hypothetical protein CL609_07560 [Anaerolineaceae bacterium]|nr:hypothetical protein [Anaerolineaceae bacterium]
MSNSKAVVFDVYKTLIDIESDEQNIETYEFISSWLSYKGLHIEPEDLRRKYRQIAKQEILANNETYPDIDIVDVFNKILITLCNVEKANDIQKDAEEMGLLFRILTTKSLTIYRETVPVLQALYNRKIRLAILSNTQRLFTLPELRKFDIEKYFDCILFSSDVRVSKPSSKIFETLLNAMKIEPQDTIYVGDNLFDDIFGAQRVGMKTVWIDRKKDNAFPSEFEKPNPDKHIKEITSENLLDAILSLV